VTRGEQVVEISASAVSFTAACERCAQLDAAAGSAGSTFAGRLDLDLDEGTFLCRRGHAVRVQRGAAPNEAAAHAAA
jgi:hypothetical protein